MCAAPRSERDGGDAETPGSTVRGLPANVVLIKEELTKNLQFSCDCNVLVLFNVHCQHYLSLAQSRGCQTCIFKADSETYLFVPARSEDNSVP